MVLPTSGPMTVAMINRELGRPENAPFNINGTAERSLAGVPSGSIAFSDFYGKSNGYTAYNSIPGLPRGGGGPAGYSGWIRRGAANHWIGSAVPISESFYTDEPEGNWRSQKDFFMVGTNVTTQQIEAAGLNPNRALRGNSLMFVRFHGCIDDYVEWGEFRFHANSPWSTWRGLHVDRERHPGRRWINSFWTLQPPAPDDIVVPGYRSTGGDHGSWVALGVGVDFLLDRPGVRQHFINRSYDMYGGSHVLSRLGFSYDEFNNLVIP